MNVTYPTTIEVTARLTAADLADSIGEHDAAVKLRRRAQLWAEVDRFHMQNRSPCGRPEGAQ